MPNPKVNEADYYQAVGEWLVERGLGERWAPNVAKSTLWSVDVLGGSQEGATVACELKCLAYPNGAAGAGAIGQALALKVFVPEVYVALVVGNSLGFKDCSWSNPKKNQRGMAELLGLTGPAPTDFSTYCNYVSELFRAQFGETGLGLLVVNADDRKTVNQVLKPATRRPSFAQPAQWLDALRGAPSEREPKGYGSTLACCYGCEEAGQLDFPTKVKNARLDMRASGEL